MFIYAWWNGSLFILILQRYATVYLIYEVIIFTLKMIGLINWYSTFHTYFPILIKVLLLQVCWKQARWISQRTHLMLILPWPWRLCYVTSYVTDVHVTIDDAHVTIDDVHVMMDVAYVMTDNLLNNIIIYNSNYSRLWCE